MNSILYIISSRQLPPLERAALGQHCDQPKVQGFNCTTIPPSPTPTPDRATPGGAFMALRHQRLGGIHCINYFDYYFAGADPHSVGPAPPRLELRAQLSRAMEPTASETTTSRPPRFHANGLLPQRLLLHVHFVQHRLLLRAQSAGWRLRCISETGIRARFRLLHHHHQPRLPQHGAPHAGGLVPTHCAPHLRQHDQPRFRPRNGLGMAIAAPPLDIR